MLRLHGILPVLRSSSSDSYLVTVTKDRDLPYSVRSTKALLLDDQSGITGYRAVLSRRNDVDTSDCTCDVFHLSNEYDYLNEGDIVRLHSGSGAMKCLYRRSAPSNSILLTEQCNHYCLMCSQPPKVADDSWVFKQAFELAQLIPKDTKGLILTGGEPTLFGSKLIELLKHLKQHLPETAIHLLSNGRAFRDFELARLYASIEHPDLMIGIPVYSDDPATHDYVVQSRGAFEETIRGILNLKKLHQRVEIRFVIHKQTVSRLRQTCEFLARNLVFIDHVALMALEITGFTRPNLPLLWIDPYEYRDVLSESVALLNSYGIPTSVYNHPLCTVNPDVFPNYRKSISDWKNEYLDECRPCKKQSDCGGFFSSGKMYRHSDHIKPFV